jgi:hypothetical protein
MTCQISYMRGSKLEPFSPPGFCQSGTALEEYTCYYRKEYCWVTGKPYAPEHKSPRITA